MRLRDAMADCLDGWRNDLPPDWRRHFDGVELAFDDIDPALMFEVWEPIFPVRKGRSFPGMPAGAHMLRAFENVAFDKIRCIVLGQDPYPEPGFATGRAFEAGNIARWSELDKMFSKSIRALTQQIVAARTGEPDYARSFADWPRVRDGIEAGTIAFDTPRALADRWQADHVLLFASALTITRFAVDIHPHQSKGHFPLWRPFVVRTLELLIARGTPLVIISLGAVAAELLAALGLREGRDGNLGLVSRHHPAQADELLRMPNPFIVCNQHLEAMGAAPVAW